MRFATEIKVFFTNYQYVVYEEIFRFANTERVVQNLFQDNYLHGYFLQNKFLQAKTSIK